MCHMSHVTCHMSHVTCHMSCVRCHVSHVTFFWGGGGTKWWSSSVEGLLSTGPTPSSCFTSIIHKKVYKISWSWLYFGLILASPWLTRWYWLNLYVIKFFHLNWLKKFHWCSQSIRNININTHKYKRILKQTDVWLWKCQKFTAHTGSFMRAVFSRM